MLSALGAERSNRWPLVAARIPESALVRYTVVRVRVCVRACVCTRLTMFLLLALLLMGSSLHN